MKNLFKILPILFWGVQQYVSAQPTIVWENTFGGTWTDYAGDILVADDGNYFALCNPASPDGDFTDGHGNQDIWLLKMDPTGQVLWQKNYGGSANESASRIVPSGDGGYLILGSTYSTDFDVSFNHGKSDVWLIKIDPDGAILWQKTLGGSEFDDENSISRTNDGNFVITAYSKSTDFDVPANNHGGGDLWVIKISTEGDIIWSKLYGGSDGDAGGTILQTNDQGYIISGSTSSSDGDVPSNQGGRDIWTLKIDSIGTIQWVSVRGGMDNDYSSGIILTSDGGYLRFSYTASINGTFAPNHGGYDAWVYKVDAAGEVQWDKFYGGSGWELMNSAFEMADGNYIFMGHAQSTDGDLAGNTGSNAWFLCIDQNGNILWKKTYGGSQSDTFARVRQISPDKLLVMGTSGSTDGDVQSGNPNNSGDIWILQMSLVATGVDNSLASPFDLSAYPNPASNYLEIRSEEPLEHAVYSITATNGTDLLRQALGSDHKIDISALPAGSYMLRLESGNKNGSKLIIKQ